MNKDEYIIINKTAIQERIKEVEKLYKNSEDNILFLQAFLQFLKDKNWL